MSNDQTNIDGIVLANDTQHFIFTKGAGTVTFTFNIQATIYGDRDGNFRKIRSELNIDVQNKQANSRILSDSQCHWTIQTN